MAEVYTAKTQAMGRTIAINITLAPGKGSACSHDNVMASYSYQWRIHAVYYTVSDSYACLFSFLVHTHM